MDIRVSEVELLAHLEQNGPMVEVGAAFHERFGLRRDAFDALLLDLLCDSAITGDGVYVALNTPVNEAPADPRSVIWRKSERTLRFLVEGKRPLMVQLTHAGRVRLARLRDELDRGRMMDPTGLIIDERHLERDLRVKLATLIQGDTLAILSADLDNFKQVNTKLGHDGGTGILRRYYVLVRDIVSSIGGDIYRHGGDELICLFVTPSLEQANGHAETVRRAVQLEMESVEELKGLENPVTVSVGLLGISRSADATTLLKQADALREQAKNGGKNRVVVADLATIG